MKANYHTHTARCGHATGTDEDYVLAAIEQGFDELGFSDHVPWPYQDGYTHPSVRMRVDQMPGYLNSVRALAAQYKDKIHILTGFECEYFPDYMNWLADMRAENHLDYLILGNHFDHDDEYGMYFGNIRTAAPPLCGFGGEGAGNGAVFVSGAPRSVHARLRQAV